MQVVKQTSFGELMDVTRYTLYLSATEYNDIRELLNLIVIPFPSGSEEFLLQNRKEMGSQSNSTIHEYHYIR